MKLKRRAPFLGNYIVVIVTYLCVLVQLYISADFESIKTTLLWSVIFFIPTFCWMIVYYYYALLFRKFMETGVKIGWWRWTYRDIAYDQIKGVLIADGVTKGPSTSYIYENGKRVALIGLFSSENAINNVRIFPNTIIILDFKEEYKLCESILNKEDLRIILEKTSVNVYITEVVLWRYKEEILPLLIKYAERIVISCKYENYKGYTNMRLLEYLSFKNDNMMN